MQQKCGSFIHIHSVNLCLFIRDLMPLVVTDINEVKASLEKVTVRPGVNLISSHSETTDVPGLDRP